MSTKATKRVHAKRITSPDENGAGAAIADFCTVSAAINCASLSGSSVKIRTAGADIESVSWG